MMICLRTILIAVILLACGVITEAQQAKKIFRIGYLSTSDQATESARVEEIRQALRKLGYIEGENIAFEYQYGDGKLSRGPELAAELVRLKVDVIVVAGGAGPIRDAKNATNTIPIIMVGVGSDPVKVGLVKSLAHPGGNVTGLTNLQRELSGKRLELLKEAVPKLARVAVLYDPTIPDREREMKDSLPPVARALKLNIRQFEIRSTEDFENIFAALNKQRPDGLYLVGGGPLVNPNRKRVVAFALKNRMPSAYDSREAVSEGGLMSYGADFAENYRQVAWYIDKVLKGAKPADLPVQQPTKFEFVINLKTAKQIGLEIPQWTLMKADRVIK